MTQIFPTFTNKLRMCFLTHLLLMYVMYTNYKNLIYTYVTFLLIRANTYLNVWEIIKSEIEVKWAIKITNLRFWLLSCFLRWLFLLKICILYKYFHLAIIAAPQWVCGVWNTAGGNRTHILCIGNAKHNHCATAAPAFVSTTYAK
jgi:hypothetical protein